MKHQKRRHQIKHLPDIIEIAGPKSASFYERVYDIVRVIPKGKVTTYGAIGETLGLKSSARLVGNAMKAIPEEYDLPAHRVVNKTGSLTAAHMFGGYKRLRWLLERENVGFRGERIDMDKYFWHPMNA